MKINQAEWDNLFDWILNATQQFAGAPPSLNKAGAGVSTLTEAPDYRDEEGSDVNPAVERHWR